MLPGHANRPEAVEILSLMLLRFGKNAIVATVTTDLTETSKRPQGAPFRGDARIRLLRVFFVKYQIGLALEGMSPKVKLVSA